MPTIHITSTGAVRWLYDESLDLRWQGPITITRASRVEPTNDGRWTADLGPVGGPLLGPFPRRSEALIAERDWLDERLGNLSLPSVSVATDGP
ncbi:MAG TPA: hypothetical protein DCQ98_19865 [Planctomycetaceae bacterium]|nr:hypothetical protein [Planctomycetaceae bacterium]HRF00053.1 hypothetical protein [Pirellulaceae bacterium]